MLKSYHPALIPCVYLGSYISRAWGAFLFAFMFGGIIAAFVPSRRMRSLFSGKNIRSYILAAALAVTRFVFSFFGAIFVGYILDKTLLGENEEKKYGKITAAKATEWVREDFHKKSENSLEEAWDLARKALPFLLLGVAAVSYLEAYLPKEVVGAYLTGVHGVILGAAIGVPMYTPTLVEVFLVKALLNLGMSPGAAIAFLIGAPMASIASMLGVSRIINWRCMVNYAILAILAIVVGIIAGFIYMGAIKTL